MGVQKLNKAKGVKNDEFYTRLDDIVTELHHYKQHFRNKHIYCNCDNPYFSKFWEYFHVNFATLGLRQLTATYFDKTQFVNRFDYYGNADADITSSVQTPLNSHGDFRSPQCTAIMKEADIVITNPPFSLMQQFVVYLNKYATDYIFIGPLHVVSYKEVFPQIKSKRLFCGVNSMQTNDMLFMTCDGTVQRVPAWWFTTLQADVKKSIYQFTVDYNVDLHPKYDNYDAVDVNKTALLPDKYYGIMGVPLSFLKQMNYDQFELIDITKRGTADMSLRTKIYTVRDYPNYGDLNSSAVLLENNQPKITFTRLLIKRKR